MTKHDTKLIAAFEEIPETMQIKMRDALTRPTAIGAVINSSGTKDRDAKTSLGWAVHSGFVTPLGAEMVRAADAPAEAKPKRSKKAVA